MATPFVTGSAALLIEWGIIKGNDLFLYGEKAKAYLRRGARELPGFAQYPMIRWGMGHCVCKTAYLRFFSVFSKTSSL